LIGKGAGTAASPGEATGQTAQPPIRSVTISSGRYYTVFNQRLEASPTIDFRCALTERFTATSQLVELGLIRSSAALDRLAAGPEHRERLPGWPVRGGMP
jgi:hypothetical protein